MSSRSGHPRTAAARTRPGLSRLSPTAVLLWGLLGAAVCMLLLYGPFHGARYEAPGWYLQRWLAMLAFSAADATGSSALQLLAYRMQDRFVLRVLGVLVLMMALVPFGLALLRRPRAAAASAQAPGGAAPHRPGVTRSGRGARSTARPGIVFLDDGSIADGADGRAGTVRRSVAELREMAAAAGVPWHTDYETGGGARGVLEILRALEEDPVAVHRAEDLDPVAADPAHPADPGAEPRHVTDAAPATAVPPATAAPAEVPSASWASAGSGSVYTPTTLYSPLGTSTAAAGPGAGDDEDAEEHDAEAHDSEERGSEGVEGDGR